MDINVVEMRFFLEIISNIAKILKFLQIVLYKCYENRSGELYLFIKSYSAICLTLNSYQIKQSLFSCNKFLIIVFISLPF
jgi:hypothetical protein